MSPNEQKFGNLMSILLCAYEANETEIWALAKQSLESLGCDVDIDPKQGLHVFRPHDPTRNYLNLVPKTYRNED